MHTFSHKELKIATNGFHKSNKIGAGGFGSVVRKIELNSTGKRGERFHWELLEQLPTFMRKLNHILCVKISKLAIYSLDQLFNPMLSDFGSQS
ncbi:hypothetical protein CFP56_033840 [Quercus suber]|uniref:Uncharacterized protein n=1 Tax=Quercus suber TaxID=58331 RepID=A0AAW0JE32_QUESU